MAAQHEEQVDADPAEKLNLRQPIRRCGFGKMPQHYPQDRE
jgi:hypothetical protein